MDNTHAARAAFSHRHNADETFDSICHKCFHTVATEKNETALKQHELLHQCVGLAQHTADLRAVGTSA
jgi:hypothetical protein